MMYEATVNKNHLNLLLHYSQLHLEVQIRLEKKNERRSSVATFKSINFRQDLEEVSYYLSVAFRWLLWC